MPIREKIQKEIGSIPDNLLEDLYEYMKFLKYKEHHKQEHLDTAAASEQVLSKDWNSPEEDQAWADL